MRRRNPLLLFYAISCALIAWQSAAQEIHRFAYSQRIAGPGGGSLQPVFDDNVTKEDIVIFGKDVSIDHEIRTNGGNIIIFADTLSISAPIDTRVYFDYSKTQFITPPGSGFCTNAVYPVAALGGTDSSAYKSYEKFYNVSDDIWNDVSKSYELTDNAIIKPEIPGGGTACQLHGKAQTGFPDKLWSRDRFDFGALKSGDITIFASDIRFCEKCSPSTANWDGTKPEIPERGDRALIRDAALLNARGIRGSRGSMPILGCNFGAQDDPACTAVPGAWRGTGTDGGDAGSIAIHYIGVNASTAPFTGRVSVKGGQAGATEQLKASCYANTPQQCEAMPDVATRANFHIVDGAPWNSELLPKPGQDGALRIDSISSDDAVALLSVAISQLESAHAISYKELLENAGDPLWVLNYVSPTDVLSHYIQSSTATMMSSVLEMSDSHRARSKDVAKSPVPRGLTDLSLRRPLMVGVSKDVLARLRYVSRLNATAKSPSLYSWASDVGGAFDLHSSDPTDLFFRLDTRTNFLALGTAFANADKSAFDLRQQLFEQFSISQREVFKSKLNSLRMAISAAEEAARKRGDDFKNALDFFARLGDDSGKAAASYETGNWIGLAGDVADIGDDLVNLDQSIRSLANVDELRKVYAEVTADYNDFLEYIKQQNLSMVKQRNDTLARLVEAQSAYNNSLGASRRALDDLLRLAVMTKISEGTGDAGAEDLAITLGELQKIESSYPATTPDLTLLRNFTDQCVGEGLIGVSQVLQNKSYPPISCMLSEPMEDKPTVLRLTEQDPDFPGLVLYRFPAGALPKVMNLHFLVTASRLSWGTE